VTAHSIIPVRGDLPPQGQADTYRMRASVDELLAAIEALGSRPARRVS